MMPWQKAGRWLAHVLSRSGPDVRLPVVLTQRRIFILPSGTGLLYALVLVIMLLGAINYDLSLGHALVFLLAGLGLVAMVHTFRNLFALTISPARTDPVFAGQMAKIRLLVKNPRQHDKRSLVFSIGKNPAGETDIPPFGQALVEISFLTSRRGRVSPGHISASTRYPLGLFRAWSYPHPPLSFIVFPAPVDTPLPLHFLSAHNEQTFGLLGNEDFTGLRPHHPSDPPRHIAWKAVARDIDNRPLLVKQFDGGGEGQLLIDWALTPPGLDTEARLSILCGWILRAEKQRLQYSLRLPELTTPTSSGAAHRDACLEALALHGEAR